MQFYSMVPILRAAEERSLSGDPTAIGAYNVNFYAQAEGIMRGLKEAEAPGIIQASKGACKFTGGPQKVASVLNNAMEQTGAAPVVALHLDHGNDEAARDCIENGFSSVMIDASDNPVFDNVAQTKAVVDTAHKKGLSVEGEYGLLAGVEEDVEHTESKYANPRLVPAMFELSGADALAVAYGTSHGPTKGRTDLLNLAIVSESYAGLRALGMNLDHFLVSHGSSTVPTEFVEKINNFGGSLSDTSGVPEQMIKMAIAMGMRKINIDTDLRLAMTGYMRENLCSKGGDELAAKSEPVKKIKGVLDGDIQAVDKNGNTVKPEEITDPRSWLKPIMKETPEVLTEPYEETKDEAFINLMQGLSDVVTKHVSRLSGEVFGGQGLVNTVNRDLNPDKMAQVYASRATV